MTEHPPKTKEELSRERLEEARLELEKQALFRRISEETNPSVPKEDLAQDEDYVPTHTISPGNPAETPDEVIEKEKLGRK